MITLTLKEWTAYKDEWAKSHDIGTKVIVYSRPIIYSKKRSQITVYGKFILGDNREWVKL